MTDADARTPATIAYCTNVHAGATLAQTRDQLDRHATEVRRRRDVDVLPLGLWLSAATLAELRGDALDAFASWLDARGLRTVTLNGFPYGDFHRDVVKHDVYRPHWADPRRAEYTIDLAHALVLLAEERAEASISTLPVGWPTDVPTDDDRRRAADALLHVATELEEIEHTTGSYLHLDLEPEPGCVLGTSVDLARFFADHLLGRGVDARVRRYLRVCHDICHAAVMFEDQAAMLATYDALGITIGKVQVSSAVRAPFDGATPPARAAMLDDLRAFAEPTYLHQTTILADGASTATLHEDLPNALASGEPAGEWRVHFHVPIFASRLGHLSTTRDAIDDAVRLFRARPEIRLYEIETYAWHVLPTAHRGPSLAADIATELDWFHARRHGEAQT